MIIILDYYRQNFLLIRIDIFLFWRAVESIAGWLNFGHTIRPTSWESFQLMFYFVVFLNAESIFGHMIYIWQTTIHA